MEVTGIFDVAVIGAGPAGSSAAIALARTGAKVAILEAGHFPREKVCGEFVSPESLGLLRSLLSGSEHESLVSNAVRIGEARFMVDDHCTSAQMEPTAASIPRVTMDFALWRAAQSAGATVIEDTPALRIQEGEPFSILLDRGHHIGARCVIDATGRWSRLRMGEQSALLATNPLRWIGLKAHFSETGPHLSVDLYFFEAGYCGVQPVGKDEINVCAMVRSDCARSLEEVWPLHAGLSLRARHWKRTSEVVSTAPLIFRPRKPVDGSVVHVGDAAGFIDPFVGDGIALALRSGHLAATTLAQFLGGECSLPEAVRRYERRYFREFEPVFRSAERMRALLSLPRPLRALTLEALKVPSIAGYVVRKTRGRVEPHPPTPSG